MAHNLISKVDRLCWNEFNIQGKDEDSKSEDAFGHLPTIVSYRAPHNIRDTYQRSAHGGHYSFNYCGLSPIGQGHKVVWKKNK